MIIQCEKCSTKYRFDENLMEGEGIWVRCSRCKHEFFQENLFARPFPAVDEDAVLKHLDDLRSGIKDREPEDLSFENLPEEEEETSVVREGVGGREEKPARGKGGFMRYVKGFFKILMIFVLVVLFAAMCLWSYMQAGGMSFKDITSSIPYLDQVFPAEDPGVVKLSQIKIANLKQRYVQHWILGNLLVVEGKRLEQYNLPGSPDPGGSKTVRRQGCGTGSGRSLRRESSDGYGTDNLAGREHETRVSREPGKRCVQ